MYQTTLKPVISGPALIIPRYRLCEEWEALLGIRLLEPLFGMDCQTIGLPLHRWALDKQSVH